MKYPQMTFLKRSFDVSIYYNLLRFLSVS